MPREQNPVGNTQGPELENSSVEANVETTSEVTVEALQQQLQEATAKLEDYSSQLEAVNNKNKELLSEKQKRIAREKELEEQAKLAEEQVMKEEGNYKQLYESLKAETESKLSAQEEKYGSLLSEIKQEKIMTEALKIANESNAIKGKATELMAQDIAKNLDIVDGKIVARNGDTLSDNVGSLKEYYATSDDWAALRNSNRSSGGSAEGQGTQSTKAKMTYAEFAEKYSDPQAQLGALENSVELTTNN